MSTSHLAHHLTPVNLYREDRAHELGADSAREAREHAALTGRRPKHVADPAAPADQVDQLMRDVDMMAVAIAVTDTTGRAA